MAWGGVSALGWVTVPAAEISAITWGGVSAVRQEMEGILEAWTQKKNMKTYRRQKPTRDKKSIRYASSVC
jgi:hypothetical protein